MAVTNGYITLAELQAIIDTTGQARWTAADEWAQEIAINAASRWIDEHTGTRYYTTTLDETRYYQTDNYRRLWLQDDLLSITTLKTDDDDDGVYETTWATTDYLLKPDNATLNGEPFRWIETDRNSSNSFPVHVQRGIEIVGKFGYSSGEAPTAPAPVRQACALLAHRLWKRKDAVFGVAGASALGVTTVQSRITRDSDIVQMLNGVSRRVGFF